jgi:hypothetical protein
MNLLGLLFSMALAVGKKPTTWLIDGNNVLGTKGTPRDAEVLAEKLKPIASAEWLVLVFDGKPGVSRTEVAEGKFRKIQLGEGMSADDFILEEINLIGAQSKTNRVKLVTADKRLRSFALGNRPTVKQVVNPATFWKKYMPRLAGLKKRSEPVETKPFQ